ncbi:MAG: response regulator transcription factor [Solirubrobacteraceae bacterium]
MSLDGAQVLVIDDDVTIRALLRRIVEMAGATVTEAETGEEGLRALYAGRPDVVILDIGLPGLDGWQVLERIRQLTDLPVVMVSAHDDELEKVRALQAGADDYVTKPFGAPELLARLQVQVRRGRASSPGGDRPLGPYRDDVLTVDFVHAEAAVRDEPIALTPREFRLLAAFVGHAGRTLSAEQLLDLAWDDPTGDPRRVKVYVGYLRAKLIEAGLAPSPIETVRGFGYRYRPPAAKR